MTEVNLYLESKDKKLKTYQFVEDVANIDTARTLLFKYINPFYLSSKYKITVKDRFEYSEIDIIFEQNIELNREFLLKEILNDD
jgi:hypothetical protein